MSKNSVLLAMEADLESPRLHFKVAFLTSLMAKEVILTWDNQPSLFTLYVTDQIWKIFNPRNQMGDAR